MATDATPGGTNVVRTATGRIDIRATASANLSPKVPPWASLEPRHAARLLEHVRTWQRRLRDAVDRHYDPRAYDVAPELHDVVDRASADLVRVFGDVGLRAPVEAHDGPRPRRGQLSMAVLHAPDADRAAVATGDPDVAVAALTGWATWLEDRAAAMPAPITAGAQAERQGDDPRLDEYLPAKAFASPTFEGMRVDRNTLARWESERRVRSQDNGKKDGRRRVKYLVRDVVRERRPTPEQLAEWLAGLPR